VTIDVDLRGFFLDFLFGAKVAIIHKKYVEKVTIIAREDLAKCGY